MHTTEPTAVRTLHPWSLGSPQPSVRSQCQMRDIERPLWVYWGGLEVAEISSGEQRNVIMRFCVDSESVCQCSRNKMQICHAVPESANV